MGLRLARRGHVVLLLSVPGCRLNLSRCLGEWAVTQSSEQSRAEHGAVLLRRDRRHAGLRAHRRPVLRGRGLRRLLRPMYPEDDLADGSAARRLTLFLAQYWGGPSTYSQERGHPRLRMRHAPFAVTPKAGEHWLRHFRAGLDEVGADAGAGREVLGLRHLCRAVHAQRRGPALGTALTCTFLIPFPPESADTPNDPPSPHRRRRALRGEVLPTVVERPSMAGQ